MTFEALPFSDQVTLNLRRNVEVHENARHRPAVFRRHEEICRVLGENKAGAATVTHVRRCDWEEAFGRSHECVADAQDYFSGDVRAVQGVSGATWEKYNGGN